MVLIMFAALLADAISSSCISSIMTRRQSQSNNALRGLAFSTYAAVLRRVRFTGGGATFQSAWTTENVVKTMSAFFTLSTHLSIVDRSGASFTSSAPLFRFPPISADA